MFLNDQHYSQPSNHDQGLADQLAYWRKQLAGVPVLLELPTDRSRPATQSQQPAHHNVHFSASLRDALNVLSQQQGATLSMTLLAAFQVLLYRYCGQHDLVTGVPIAVGGQGGGPGDGWVNTLALRSNLAGNPRFSALLEQVRSTTLAAYAHPDVPLQRLVEALQIQRDPSYHPLFQVIFALHPESAGTHPGLPMPGFVERFFDRKTARCDLALELTDSAEGLTGTLTYNRDLFDEPTITRLAVHFGNLLDGIAADPEQPIGELALLTAVEQEQLLMTWNQPTTAAQPNGSQDLCIYQLVEARARQTPAAIAVVSEQETLSYAELNHRANQLAHHLRGLGVGPERIVGLYVERSVELIIGMLGILKAGAAYLPIDPTYPQERIAFMLEDARISLVLTQRRLVSSCPRSASTLICLDTDWPAQAGGSNPVPVSQPRNLSYVIYTSGSTGRPKGVQISHAALMNLVAWHNRAYAITPADRATQLAGLGFDAAVWEIWPYLAAGASLYLPDETTRTSPQVLLKWLVKHQITVSFMPTPLAEILLREDWPAAAALRLLLVGGDKLHRYPRPGLPFTVVNNYGPTENTVVSTWNALTPGEDTVAAPPIGRPVDQVHVYVLDRYLQPVPVGVPGELYVGGASLGRGYLNRPDLTAERFIPNPFPIPGSCSTPESPSIGGGRLYRTGDLVRYLPDGNLVFLGRIDTQVKIRGFRIELGEIESVLTEHPQVRAAVVIDREDGGSKYLAAYLVPELEAFPRLEEVQRFLHARLPEYMVPSSYTFLEALPLTPNGKVNRQALPTPSQIVTGADARRHCADQPIFYREQAPLNGMLINVRDTWEDVLQMKTRTGKPVGVDDDFIQIGGDSIQAIHLVLALGRKGIEVGVSDIFRYRTVNALSAHLQSRQ